MGKMIQIAKTEKVSTINMLCISLAAERRSYNRTEPQGKLDIGAAEHIINEPSTTS